MVDVLTVPEERFLIDHIENGLSLAECWKRYNPDSEQSDDLARRSGWKVLQRIKTKCSNWQEVFSRAGADPSAIAIMLLQALEATKTIVISGKPVEVPDHMVRVKAGSLLADIHGLKDQTVNVKTEQPLPMIINVTAEDPEQAAENYQSQGFTLIKTAGNDQ